MKHKKKAAAAPTAQRPKTNISTFKYNLSPSPRQASGPRHIGDVGAVVVGDIGRRLIIRRLEAGNLDAANEIRRSMCLSWADVVGADERAA